MRWAVVYFSFSTIFLPAEPIRFPADSGVIDVTLAPYSAKGDGETDDTATLQKALDDHPSQNAIIFLPDGVYKISRTLRWPEGPRGGLEQKRVILQGQSTEKTVIRLADKTFTDPAKPEALVWTGKKPAQRFRNAIRNLTLHTGLGNPGAIGLQFIANNQGGLRQVKIVSGDGSGPVGLDMGYTDEIGPLFVRDLEVIGFDIGIKTWWQTASVTFENVTLSEQNLLGWENSGQTVFIRNLTSRNAVPALKNVKNAPSRVLLLGAKLTGLPGAGKHPAIINEKTLYAADVLTRGYARAVKHDDKGRGNTEGVPGPNADEWLSHGQPFSLFPKFPRPEPLPVKETPQAVRDPLENWSGPHLFGGKPDDDLDDTAAIQKAINSGATTIYLPNGTWNLEGDVTLAEKTNRFLGTEARLSGKGTLRVKGISEIPLVIERLDIIGVSISHDSQRTLVLSSLLGGKYLTTLEASDSDLFLEDVVMETFWFGRQSVWARQLNQETDASEGQPLAKIVNDGGHLWILGLKTEKSGTVLRTSSGGKTETWGAFIFNNTGSEGQQAFINDNSKQLLAGAWTTSFGKPPYENWLRHKSLEIGRSETLSGKEPTPLLSY